jgi:hypothetical protein
MTRGVRGRGHQSGSITVEYVMVSLVLAVLVWATIIGVEWETEAGGKHESGELSLMEAMESERDSYRQVLTDQ